MMEKRLRKGTKKMQNDKNEKKAELKIRKTILKAPEVLENRLTPGGPIPPSITHPPTIG